MSISPNPATYTITDLENAVGVNLPNLTEGKLYLLEDLAGEAFWNTLPKGRRTILGQEFKVLVDSDELPVTYEGRTSSNKALYKKK